jgi:hypothetical protein
MLLAGSVADTQAMAQFLGRPPLPFVPHLLFEDAIAPGATPAASGESKR